MIFHVSLEHEDQKAVKALGSDRTPIVVAV
jgi:hypothetical protein